MTGSKPKRVTRTYTQAEKLGAIVIAVRDGVGEASRLMKLPDRTIYCWLQEAGGVAEVRALANMRAEEALSRAEQSVYEEIETRMKAHVAPDPELHTTFRTLIKSRLGDGHTETTNPNPGSAANAQVAVHNWNINANE